ncbi:hypothetical protein MA9V1_256 [Chryseobacterium phage MA9V-1]|nr:hypothetical protein MA9V1_256 [Chryseobacterium phage MA9V-1]
MEDQMFFFITRGAKHSRIFDIRNVKMLTKANVVEELRSYEQQAIVTLRFVTPGNTIQRTDAMTLLQFQEVFGLYRHSGLTEKQIKTYFSKEVYKAWKAAQTR